MAIYGDRLTNPQQAEETRPQSVRVDIINPDTGVCEASLSQTTFNQDERFKKDVFLESLGNAILRALPDGGRITIELTQSPQDN